MNKRLFRAVSAKNSDKCVSYSTYEKAYAKLQKWCNEYGYNLEAEPYDVWVHDQENPGYPHEAKCMYNFRAWRGTIAYAFTIVEMKTKEEYKQDLQNYYCELSCAY